MTAFVNETNHRYLFIVKRFQQLPGHAADAVEARRSAIAASRKIVNRDCNLPRLSGCRNACKQNCQKNPVS